MVKGRVLKEVWLTMDESITEDFNFAMHAMERVISSFNQIVR
jgi:hypothetical protein